MLDKDYGVYRLIRVFSNRTEKQIGEVELISFDLSAFQDEFCLNDKENSMFDCYRIEPGQIEFVENFIQLPIAWDFEEYSYFLEADSV